MRVLSILGLALLVALQINANEEVVADYEESRVVRAADPAPSSGTTVKVSGTTAHPTAKPGHKKGLKIKKIWHPEENRGRDDKVHNAHKIIDNLKNLGKEVRFKVCFR